MLQLKWYGWSIRELKEDKCFKKDLLILKCVMGDSYMIIIRDREFKDQ